jgi:hypothetical protein
MRPAPFARAGSRRLTGFGWGDARRGPVRGHLALAGKRKPDRAGRKAERARKVSPTRLAEAAYRRGGLARLAAFRAAAPLASAVPGEIQILGEMTFAGQRAGGGRETEAFRALRPERAYYPFAAAPCRAVCMSPLRLSLTPGRAGSDGQVPHGGTRPFTPGPRRILPPVRVPPIRLGPDGIGEHIARCAYEPVERAARCRPLRFKNAHPGSQPVLTLIVPCVTTGSYPLNSRVLQSAGSKNGS